MRNGKRLLRRNTERFAKAPKASAKLPSADGGESKAKAGLAREITGIIESRRLTQTEAATIIGATQPDISNLKNGQLNGFALERLIGFLLRLERDIKLVVKPTPRNRKGGQFAIASRG